MKAAARFLVLVLVLAAGCGDRAGETVDASTVDAIPWKVVTYTEMLPPQNLIEGSWTAGPTDAIGVSIQSTGLIDWDIHAHADGGTQEITAEFGQLGMSYDFVPPQTAQWYLLVRNSTTDTITLDVQMSLYGAGQWDGWQ